MGGTDSTRKKFRRKWAKTKKQKNKTLSRSFLCNFLETRRPTITVSHNSLINTEQCPVHLHVLSCPIRHDIVFIPKRRSVCNSIYDPETNSCYRRAKEPRRRGHEEGVCFAPLFPSLPPLPSYLTSCS